MSFPAAVVLEFLVPGANAANWKLARHRPWLWNRRPGARILNHCFRGLSARRRGRASLRDRRQVLSRRANGIPRKWSRRTADQRTHERILIPRRALMAIRGGACGSRVFWQSMPSPNRIIVNRRDSDSTKCRVDEGQISRLREMVWPASAVLLAGLNPASVRPTQ